MQALHSTPKAHPAPPEAQPNRPPELELFFTCCRWPQTPADQALIRRQLTAPLDWPRFIQLAQHHRLVPLVANNLASAASANSPTPAAASSATDTVQAMDELKRLAAADTYRALRSLSELRRLVQEFEAHHIPVRVLKGLPLAQSIFGDLRLRAVGDIDLLIDQASILAADQVLRDFGYVGLFQLDRFTPKRLAFYSAHWKDLAYRNPRTGHEVDLHWRCFRNAAMPGAAALCATPGQRDQPQPTVAFGSFQVATLPPMETLLYLCVHGTLDGWLYLKSLADVAAQVRTLPAAQLDTLAALASSYGVLPELTAALLLVRRYFGPHPHEDQPPAYWSPQLLPATHPTVAHILRFATRSLERDGFFAGREAISAASMMAFEIGLRSNLRYRIELAQRVLFRARMWETIPLPDALFALYPLLSPFEWIAFRLRQRLAPPTTLLLSI